MKTKLFFLIVILVFLFSLNSLLNTVFAQESKIWTDKDTYGEGDYITVYIQLPEEKFSSCDTYLIDPSGREFHTGGGGCGAGVTERFDSRWMTEPEETYTPSGEIWEFSSSYYLEDNFGTWGVKVLVKQDDQVVKTLTTNFEYEYYNAIIGHCRLENEKTKICEFLGSPFEITKDGGCGPNPVEITVSYFGGTHTFNIAQGDTETLTVGLITVRNMGSPCAADVLNLRFDKAIPPTGTTIKASVENKNIEADIDGEMKTFSLPTEEKTQIIEARVEEEDRLKKIYVEIDNTKDVLVVESNDVEAETELDISIEGSQLYVDSAGGKTEINILPDKAVEKLEATIDHVENIEIQSEDIAYSIKGSKDARILGFIPTRMSVETKMNITTGQISEVTKPWWSFLAW